MTLAHMPWLELALVLPLVGAALLARLSDPGRRRLLALAASTAAMALVIAAWIDLAWSDPGSAPAGGQLQALITGQQLFVVDEFNAPLLPIAALITTFVLLTTLRTRRARFAYGETLVVLSLLLATLSCRQPDVLVLLLGLGVVAPLRDLRRADAPRRPFALHALAYLALLLAGWLALRLGDPGDLAASVLLSLALLLRCGVLPGHAWVVQLYEQASFGGALLFTTPLVGVYGFMRLVFPVAPDALLATIEVVALLSALVCVALSLVQSDPRRFFAYLLLSHSAIVLVGLDLVTPVGLTGALSLWFSVMLSLTGFALVLRCVEERVGRLSLDRYHGLYRHVPSLAMFFLLTGLASIGFPGTPGFAGAELLVEGALEGSPLLAVGLVLIAALSGLAVLKVYFRLFTGCEHPATLDLGLRRAERLAVLSLTLLLLGGGLMPQPGVATRHHAARALLASRLETHTHTDTPSVPDQPPAMPADDPDPSGR